MAGGDESYASTGNEIYVANAVYFALVMALHFFLEGYFKRSLPSKTYPFMSDEKKRITFIQGANAFITAFFVTAMYAYGYYSLDGSRESRWYGNNAGLMHALSLHIGLTLYDTWLYITYFPEKGIEFHVHHFMVVAAAVLSLSTGRGGAWGAWFGVVEITNMPLSGITCLPMLNMKTSPLMTVSGVLLWALFLAMRVINVPWGLYTLANDIMAEGGAGGKARYFDTDNVSNTTAVVFIWGSAFFLWVISSIWFNKITKGLVKTVLGANSALFKAVWGEEKKREKSK